MPHDDLPTVFWRTGSVMLAGLRLTTGLMMTKKLLSSIQDRDRGLREHRAGVVGVRQALRRPAHTGRDGADGRGTMEAAPQRKRFQRGNARACVRIEAQRVLQLVGEWHADWIDRSLTIEQLKAVDWDWRACLGADAAILSHVGADAHVDACVAWLQAHAAT